MYVLTPLGQWYVDQVSYVVSLGLSPEHLEDEIAYLEEQAYYDLYGTTDLEILYVVAGIAVASYWYWQDDEPWIELEPEIAAEFPGGSSRSLAWSGTM